MSDGRTVITPGDRNERPSSVYPFRYCDLIGGACAD